MSDAELAPLKEWRRERADGKPAYTVATDATLREIVRREPATERELLDDQGHRPLVRRAPQRIAARAAGRALSAAQPQWPTHGFVPTLVALAADPQVAARGDAAAAGRRPGRHRAGVVAERPDLDGVRLGVVVARAAAGLALGADADPDAGLEALAPGRAGVVHLRAVLAGRAVVVDVQLADLLAADLQVLRLDQRAGAAGRGRAGRRGDRDGQDDGRDRDERCAQRAEHVDLLGCRGRSPR